MFKVIKGMELSDPQEEAFNDFWKLLRNQWANSPHYRDCALDLVSGRSIAHSLVVHITGAVAGTSFQLEARNEDPIAACSLATFLINKVIENFKVPDQEL